MSYNLINIFILITHVCFTMGLEESLTDIEDESKILSRRKRYLIFPDGSSFQLVFCAQNQGYIQVGDIVWFGNTAALAWELPTDPKYFNLIKEHNKDFILNRNGVSKSIYYLDEYGKVLSKMPYHTRFLVNPAMTKRSSNHGGDRIDSNSIKSMHMKQANISYFTTLDESSIDFHREGRKDFYVKLERFFKALGVNGQECVLRLLCETGQGKSQQASFLEEIIKATFTFPQGKNVESNLNEVYDQAHLARDGCHKMYPNCKLAN